MNPDMDPASNLEAHNPFVKTNVVCQDECSFSRDAVPEFLRPACFRGGGSGKATMGRRLMQASCLARSPSSALLPTFLGEGSPYNRLQKKGTLILTSLLEDLVGVTALGKPTHHPPQSCVNLNHSQHPFLLSGYDNGKVRPVGVLNKGLMTSPMQMVPFLATVLVSILTFLHYFTSPKEES